MAVPQPAIIGPHSRHCDAESLMMVVVRKKDRFGPSFASSACSDALPPCRSLLVA